MPERAGSASPGELLVQGAGSRCLAKQGGTRRAAKGAACAWEVVQRKFLLEPVLSVMLREGGIIAII